MKPPRPLLSIEIFEDRLLPSSLALFDSNSSTTFPQNPSDVSILPSRYTETSELVSVAGPVQSTVANVVYLNTAANLNAVPIEVITLQLTDGWFGNYLIGTITIQSVLDVLPQRLTPADNYEDQTPPADPLNGYPDPAAPIKSVSTTASDTNTTEPQEVSAPVSPPSDPAASTASTTPGVLLASPWSQQGKSAAIVSAQPSATESRLFSEMTLAAVSLASPQGLSLIPSTQSLMTPYLTSANFSNLPTNKLNNTSTVVNAPAHTRFTPEAADLQSSLSPIEVNAPTGDPVDGVIVLNAMDLDERVSNVLSSISSLSAEITVELGQPDAYTWLVAAGLLSVGAGYSAWINRKSKRVQLTLFGKRSLGSWEGGI
jgi:hypothetical protein